MTIRTLRYYDEIGMFSPVNIGDTSYRYYELSLLCLQHILFFREMDLIQLADATQFTQVAKAAGVEVRLEVWEKMQQVWQMPLATCPRAARRCRKLGNTGVRS